MSTARSTQEWIGATADAPVPQRVRLRVFARDNGHCRICTRKIASGDRWITDHAQALINGGENREKNLQTICDWCDRKVKTPADVAEKAKTARIRAKHLGIKPKSRFACSRDGKFRKKINGTVELR